MQELKELLSVPFRWGGRDKATGLDCYGLAQEVRKIIFPDSVPLPAYDSVCTTYDRESLPRTLIWDLFAASGRAKKKDVPSMGDLALVLGQKGIAIATYLGDFDGCERVIAFGASERPELLPIAAVRVVAYWRVSDEAH
jgi:hypothetical protein